MNHAKSSCATAETKKPEPRPSGRAVRRLQGGVGMANRALGGPGPTVRPRGLAWSAAPPQALSGDALVEHEYRESQVVEDDAHADGSDEGGGYRDRGPEPPVARAPA